MLDTDLVQWLSEVLFVQDAMLGSMLEHLLWDEELERMWATLLDSQLIAR
jgi:hypothetical protein